MSSIPFELNVTMLPAVYIQVSNNLDYENKHIYQVYIHIFTPYSSITSSVVVTRSKRRGYTLSDQSNLRCSSGNGRE